MVSTEQKKQILRAGFTGFAIGVGFIPVGAAKAQTASGTSQSIPLPEAHREGPSEEQLPPESNVAIEFDAPEYVAVSPTWLAEEAFYQAAPTKDLPDVALAPTSLETGSAEPRGDWAQISLTPPPTEAQQIEAETFAFLPQGEAIADTLPDSEPIDSVSAEWAKTPVEPLVAVAPTWITENAASQIEESSVLPQIALPEPTTDEILATPEWQRTPEQIAYEEAVAPSLEILAESNEATTGEAPSLTPDWLQPAEQIAFDPDVVVLTRDVAEEEEEEDKGNNAPDPIDLVRAPQQISYNTDAIVFLNEEEAESEAPEWIRAPEEISYNTSILEFEEASEGTIRDIPDWLKSPEQISYTPGISIAFVDETEAESEIPDWIRSPQQISYNPDVVLSSGATTENDQRISLNTEGIITSNDFEGQLINPDNNPLIWGSGVSQLMSGDSSMRVAVSPTWLNEADANVDLPDWIEQINDNTTTLSLTDVANQPTTLNSEDWIAATPELIQLRNRGFNGLSLTLPLSAGPSVLGENGLVPRLAVSSPGLSDPSQVVYDVRALPQIAITPEALASNPNEVAIAVSANQVEILTPQSGAILDIPSTPVALQFPVGAKIALLVNGHLIDDSKVGRTETDPNTQLRIQTWYGISLESGDNLIEVVSTETGQVFASSPVIVRGQPEDITLFAPLTLPADGVSTGMIRGQLIDEVGIASIWNTTVTLNTTDGQFIGTDQEPDQPGFQVDVINGEFSAELQSSLSSGLVQLQVTTSSYEAFRQIQFVTPQRSSLISGVVDLRFGARGTDYYSSLREFLPLDRDNRYELDVDAAVFATGNLGEWLYTGAYNSSRPLNENCRGESTLFNSGSGACGNSYSTTGDGSSSDYTAPSLDSLYLRLERNSPTNNTGIDYAMWGDFDTEEFASNSQLFTATNRQFHGFKANYNFGNLAITGLYANNVQGFQRDTLAPDGTSGFYFTSQRNLVPGSENVYLEWEELERPGTVLDRQQLSRGVDYDIDYDRGTLLFNDPIQRTAVNDIGQLLVQRIVTTYQYEGGGNTNVVAGRLQYDLDGQPTQDSWIGASYLSENQGDRNFSLYGVDTRIALGESAQLIAEIAQSSSNFTSPSNTSGTNVTGTAYRLELDGNLGERINGRAYYRSTGAGFTNTATTSFVPGQTRYGAQLSARIGETTSLRAQYDHEDNFGTAPAVETGVTPLVTSITNPLGIRTDNSLTTYSLGITQQVWSGTLDVDWIHRDRVDRINAASTVSSDQIRTRFSTPITRNLNFVAQNELNLSSQVDPIYPSRTLIGINWKVMPWLNIGVNQIFYGGGNNRGSATSIDVSGEHTFASNTTVRGRLSAIDGFQVGGSIGLEQGINLAPGLDLDLAYEKVFSTLGNSTAAGTQLTQSVTGQGASALALAGGDSYSIGLSYSDNSDFQASTRFEHRTSTQGSNTVFNLSAVGRLSPALTILGDYRLANTANQNITGLGTTSILKLGLAYREPEDDRFNALLRYEHRLNPNSIPASASFGSSTETQEHLFSAEAIYAPNWQWEFYSKYALRNSSTSIRGAGGNFSTSSTVQLAQARATYRIGYNWDLVGEARWLGGGGFNETGFSLEAGYYPLPDLRVSAGYSVGAANDRDFGDDRSAGGFYFGVTAKLSGLLNGFGTQPSTPPPLQTSVIDASQENITETSLENTPVTVQSEAVQSEATQSGTVQELSQDDEPLIEGAAPISDFADAVLENETQPAPSDSNTYPSATEL